MEEREYNWYRIIARETHLGAGSDMPQALYMWDWNTSNVMDRYDTLSLKGKGLPERWNSLEVLNESRVVQFKKYLKKRNWNIESAKKSIVRHRAKFGPIPV